MQHLFLFYFLFPIPVKLLKKVVYTLFCTSHSHLSLVQSGVHPHSFLGLFLPKIPDNLVVSSLSTFTYTPYLLLLRPTSEPVGCFLLGTHLSFGIGDTVTPGSPPPPLLLVLRCLGVLFLRSLILSQSSSQGPLTFFLRVLPFGNNSQPSYLESLLYKKVYFSLSGNTYIHTVFDNRKKSEENVCFYEKTQISKIAFSICFVSICCRGSVQPKQ